MGGGDEQDCDVASYCLQLSAQARVLREQNESLIETLVDVVSQACTVEGGELDSMALSAYADAMRALAAAGKIEITAEYGRRVIGRWA